MKNERFIQPTALNILGSTQNAACQTSTPQPDETTSKSSWWDRLKAKVKNVWDKAMSVARDITDNVMPIVNGLGGFLCGWAAFCNRRRGDVKRGGRQYAPYNA